MEIGPWRMHDDEQLYTEEGGWEEYTNIVYLDQPVGTGFSYAATDRYVHELSDVCFSMFCVYYLFTWHQASDQVIEFMRNFYKVFPEYQHMDVRPLLTNTVRLYLIDL
jgi:carboxypeptidase D